MSQVVQCPKCQGEGKIDLDHHAPQSAQILKIVKLHGPVTAKEIQDLIKYTSANAVVVSINCINYHLGWLEQRGYIEREMIRGSRCFKVKVERKMHE